MMNYDPIIAFIDARLAALQSEVTVRDGAGLQELIGGIEKNARRWGAANELGIVLQFIQNQRRIDGLLSKALAPRAHSMDDGTRIDRDDAQAQGEYVPESEESST
jgi:hypothetical protein